MFWCKRQIQASQRIIYKKFMVKIFVSVLYYLKFNLLIKLLPLTMNLCYINFIMNYEKQI